MRLMDDTPKGGNSMRLANPGSLLPNDLLSVDASEPDLTEHMGVATVTSGATAGQPLKITLRHPLAYQHRRDALVRRVVLQPSGINNLLDQDLNVSDPNANAQDVCVLLNSSNDLDQPAGQAFVAEITSGPTVEYHRFKTFSVTSDAQGFFRLPQLSRVAQLEITADRGAGNPLISSVFSPDYTNPANRVDFVFWA